MANQFLMALECESRVKVINCMDLIKMWQMASKPICRSLLKMRFFLGFGRSEIYIIKALKH